MNISRKANKKTGFTLIELLIVIAIIGMLSAIVLAALGSARSKGSDASIKAQLHSARSQAELYATTHPTTEYLGVCAALASAQGLASIETNALAAAGKGGSIVLLMASAGTWQNVTCHDSNTSWVIEAPLTGSISSTNVSMWCVDSNGAAKAEPATGTGATATYNIQANATACS